MNPDSISEWDDMSCITVQNSIYSKHDQTHSFSPCYRPAPAAVHTLIDDSINSEDLKPIGGNPDIWPQSPTTVDAHKKPQKNITGITIQMRTRNNSSSSSSISSNETICSESTKSSVVDQQRIRLHQEKLKNQQLQQKIFELQKQENDIKCARKDIKLQCPLSPSKPSNPPVWKTQQGECHTFPEIITCQSQEQHETDNYIHGSILYDSECNRRVKLVLKCTGEAFRRNFIHEYTFVDIEAEQPYQWPFKVGVHKKDKPGRIHFLTKYENGFEQLVSTLEINMVSKPVIYGSSKVSAAKIDYTTDFIKTLDQCIGKGPTLPSGKDKIQSKDEMDDESMQSTILRSNASTPIQQKSEKKATFKSVTEVEKSRDDLMKIYKQSESKTRIDYK